jgi:plasmid stabilization system protein ParE
MSEIEVDYEAMLAAARREAEVWRTAKDRLAEQLNAAEAARDALLTDLHALREWFGDKGYLVSERELGRVLGKHRVGGSE